MSLCPRIFMSILSWRLVCGWWQQWCYDTSTYQPTDCGTTIHSTILPSKCLDFPTGGLGRKGQKHPTYIFSRIIESGFSNQQVPSQKPTVRIREWMVGRLFLGWPPGRCFSVSFREFFRYRLSIGNHDYGRLFHDSGYADVSTCLSQKKSMAGIFHN